MPGTSGVLKCIPALAATASRITIQRTRHGHPAATAEFEEGELALDVGVTLYRYLLPYNDAIARLLADDGAHSAPPGNEVLRHFVSSDTHYNGTHHTGRPTLYACFASSALNFWIFWIASRIWSISPRSARSMFW